MSQNTEDNVKLTSFRQYDPPEDQPIDPGEVHLEEKGVEDENIDAGIDLLKAIQQPNLNTADGHVLEKIVEPIEETGNCYVLLENGNFEGNVGGMFMDFMKQQNDIHQIDMMPVSSMKQIRISTECPIILPCVHASRIGTDVSTMCTKFEVEGERKVLLVIFHLKSENEKSIVSSNLVLPSAAKRSTSLIVDVIYRRHNKLAGCQFNRNSRKILLDHLKTALKQSSYSTNL